MLVILGRLTAEERLATFLATFSAALDLSATDLTLVMPRQDIGHYLGLAPETVSRLFSRFQEHGLIEIVGRQVRLLDPDRVDSLAHAGVAAAVRGHDAWYRFAPAGFPPRGSSLPIYTNNVLAG